LVPICLLVAAGRFAARWLRRNAPQSELIRPIPSKRALYPALLLLMFGTTIFIREFEPETSLGQLFNTRFGLIAAFGVATLLYLAIVSSVSSIFRWLNQRRRGGV
jgi:polyferredoxin